MGLAAALVVGVFVAGSVLSRGGAAAPAVGGSPGAGHPSAANRAEDLLAQADLKAAFSAAAAAFDQGNSWAGAGPLQLSVLDPSLTYVDGSIASTGPSVVSLQASPAGWGAAAMSASGTCFYIHVAGMTPVARYGSGATCTGQAAMGANGSAW